MKRAVATSVGTALLCVRNIPRSNRRFSRSERRSKLNHGPRGGRRASDDPALRHGAIHGAAIRVRASPRRDNHHNRRIHSPRQQAVAAQRTPVPARSNPVRRSPRRHRRERTPPLTPSTRSSPVQHPGSSYSLCLSVHMVCKRVVYATECRRSALIQVLPECDKSNEAYLFLKSRRQAIPAAIAGCHVTALRIVAVQLADVLARTEVHIRI